MSLLDYWDTSCLSAKRRKTAHNTLSAPSQGHESWDTESAVSKSLDADPADEGSGDEPPNSQTDLESSLPAMQRENGAIEEYESSHTTDQNDKDGLHEHLQDGVRQKGKSSIYVDAFNLALDTVLDEEAHLFNEAEMEVFRQWRELSYESQYLYGASAIHDETLTCWLDTFGSSFAKLLRGTESIGWVTTRTSPTCLAWCPIFDAPALCRVLHNHQFLTLRTRNPKTLVRAVVSGLRTASKKLLPWRKRLHSYCLTS